jgi:hypothetical protein
MHICRYGSSKPLLNECIPEHLRECIAQKVNDSCIREVHEMLESDSRAAEIYSAMGSTHDCMHYSAAAVASALHHGHVVRTVSSRLLDLHRGSSSSTHGDDGREGHEESGEGFANENASIIIASMHAHGSFTFVSVRGRVFGAAEQLLPLPPATPISMSNDEQMSRMHDSGVVLGSSEPSGASGNAAASDLAFNSNDATRHVQGIWEQVMRMRRRESAAAAAAASSTSAGSASVSQGPYWGPDAAPSATDADTTTTSAAAAVSSTPEMIPEQIVMGSGISQSEVVSSFDSPTVGLIVYLYLRGGNAAGSSSCYDENGMIDDPAVLSCPWTIHTLEYDLSKDDGGGDGAGEGGRRVYEMYGDQVMMSLFFSTCR